MRAPAGAWIGRRHERSAAPSVPSGGRVQSALHGGDLPSAAGGRVVLRSCICSRPRLSHTQPSPPPAPAGTGWPAAARASSRESARARACSSRGPRILETCGQWRRRPGRRGAESALHISTSRLGCSKSTHARRRARQKGGPGLCDAGSVGVIWCPRLQGLGRRANHHALCATPAAVAEVLMSMTAANQLCRPCDSSKRAINGALRIRPRWSF